MLFFYEKLRDQNATNSPNFSLVSNNSISFWFYLKHYVKRHGLQTPNEAFGLGQTIWADKFWGIWGIFKQFISTHFGTVCPLSIFSINQSLFLQKTKPLYRNTKYLFGLGFEFGPQIIGDLVIVCP